MDTLRMFVVKKIGTLDGPDRFCLIVQPNSTVFDFILVPYHFLEGIVHCGKSSRTHAQTGMLRTLAFLFGYPTSITNGSVQGLGDYCKVAKSQKHRVTLSSQIGRCNFIPMVSPFLRKHVLKAVTVETK